MKKLILLALIGLSLNSFGQSKTSTSEQIGKFGYINIKFIKGEKEGIDYAYFFLSFRNKEYEHITDMTAVGLFNMGEFDNFILYMNEAIDKSNSKVSASWKINDDSEIKIRQNSKWLYLYNGNKYTTISTKKAKKMIEVLKSKRNYLLK